MRAESNESADDTLIQRYGVRSVPRESPQAVTLGTCPSTATAFDPSHGASSAGEPAFLPGDIVDRYQILRHVAVGGMGSVWMARYLGHSGFEKRVAIKALLPGYAWDPEMHAMFLDEARLASRLTHPNIAQVLDCGERDGFLYLVFEWIDGVNLAVMRRGKAPSEGLDPLLRAVADVCAGLHAAHELCDETGEPLHVIHRDVTPWNIVVGTYGFAKLIDFGVARTRARLAADTAKGSVKGTPRFMAPEHAVGGTLDRRADIWSLGAVLYHAITGWAPFDTTVELIDYASGLRPSPQLPDGVPWSLRLVVERAMMPRPEERFDTAEQMRWALEETIVELRCAKRVMSPRSSAGIPTKCT
jgi:serine/threonine-protein kinase